MGMGEICIVSRSSEDTYNLCTWFMLPNFNEVAHILEVRLCVNAVNSCSLLICECILVVLLSSFDVALLRMPSFFLLKWVKWMYVYTIQDVNASISNDIHP